MGPFGVIPKLFRMKDCPEWKVVPTGRLFRMKGRSEWIAASMKKAIPSFSPHASG